jgi:periplasmic protein TonB
MPADLFGDTVRGRPPGSRRWYTLPLSIVTHAAVILAVVAIPIVVNGELPAVRRAMAFRDIEIVPVAPPPPRGLKSPSKTAINSSRRELAPIVSPPSISDEPVGDPSSDVGVPGGDPVRVDFGVPIDTSSTFVSPLPPPLPDKPIGPVRPGGHVVAPKRLAYVQPGYPTIAQSSRIEGRVVIEAIVGPTGDVTSLRVVQSVPFLNEAALAAVRQWKYTPTLLNGVPVSIILTVSVDFKLSR